MTIRERIQLWNFRNRRAGAFDAIYAEYGRRVFRFCLRLTESADDAEDLTQDVFVGALGGLDRFEGRSSISTWLYRIAVLQWRTRQRLRAAERRDVPIDSIEAQAIAAPDAPSVRFERMRIDAAIGALPEAHRNAFILVKAEGLTCREAGEVLQIPEGTVRYHVHQAIVALRNSANLSDLAAPIMNPDSATAEDSRLPTGIVTERNMQHEL